jgi:hypothetical protein
MAWNNERGEDGRANHSLKHLKKLANCFEGAIIFAPRQLDLPYPSRLSTDGYHQCQHDELVATPSRRAQNRTILRGKSRFTLPDLLPVWPVFPLLSRDSSVR